MSDQIHKQAWAAAKTTNELILGIDDFAIKKGHTYNTGIHSLRGETMLDVLPGRRLEDLRAYAKAHPDFWAPAYHTWIRDCFPHAIRIADRFHVHGYVIECVQSIRKAVQQTLSPCAKGNLKKQASSIIKSADRSPKERSQKQLSLLLSYSLLLRQTWEWKEAFTNWYDCCSPNGDAIEIGFERWCVQGGQIEHRRSIAP